MENNLEAVMGTRSDKQLEELINKRIRYKITEVEGAVAELEKRGRIFSYAELLSIEKDLREMKKELNLSNSSGNFTTTLEKQDSGIPEYFSPLAINIFTILFSALYGVVLMAINFNRSGNKKGMINMLVFGSIIAIGLPMLFFQLPFLSGNNFMLNFSIRMVFNIVCSLVLTQFFWPKYLGKEIQYKPRSISGLMSISLLICFGIVLLMFQMGETSAFYIK